MKVHQRLQQLLCIVAHPSVLAFVLLIGICAIGVYIIRSARFNKPIETFVEQLPSNIQVPDYASLVASAVKSTTPKTEAECKANYEFCITGGGLLKECWAKYKVCLASVPQAVQTPTQQPQPNANPMNIPSVANLQTIQEGSTASPTVPILTLEEIKSLYLPLAQQAKPHEQTAAKPTPLTSSLPTDKGTMAEQIQRSSVLAPSMRDMIRRDVSDIMRQELEGAQYDNPNEIRYS